MMFVFIYLIATSFSLSLASFLLLFASLYPSPLY